MRMHVSSLFAALALAAAPAWAQEHRGHGGPAPGSHAGPGPAQGHPAPGLGPGPGPGHSGPVPGRGPGWQLDQRYHHDHYYPARGSAVAVLPVGSVSLSFGGGPWYFNGGVWFRPWGGRFVVSIPPIGIVLPLLPPAYVSLWIGGAPYYYANGVYYAPAPGGYAVVPPPAGAEAAQAPPPPPPAAKPPPDPIIYPRNGQSPEQTESDRRQCNTWATTQPQAMADASVFHRAVTACMEGRGYTVR